MLLIFYLLLIGLQGYDGCKLEKSRTLSSLSTYLGGSVLLPCYCTDLNTTPGKFTWQIFNKYKWEEVSNESGQYRGRVQLFNSHSPGNLSLLISHLTEEDGGDYTCDSKRDHVIIRLSVQTPPDCSLDNKETQLHITARPGGSVLLPCYCTDLQTKPHTFSWRRLYTTWREIWREGQSSIRYQVFNSHSPGNLSLLISHLTEEDGGEYSCELRAEYRDVTLTVGGLTPTTTTAPTTTTTAPTTTTTAPTTTALSTAVVKVPQSLSTSSTASSQTPAEHGAVTPAERSPQSLPFVPFALVTVILLHMVVGVVYYTKRNKGPARVHYRTADGDGAVSLE
ncbi:limbic system-associated membrane protein-like [Hoplias malabaricus]|uniref:limbic system-associated membrane protein-like n=1 Tax=Hoplias malabaricus TaxID=27720 RepID=UPI0034628F68